MFPNDSGSRKPVVKFQGRAYSDVSSLYFAGGNSGPGIVVYAVIQSASYGELFVDYDAAWTPASAPTDYWGRPTYITEKSVNMLYQDLRVTLIGY